MRHEPGQLDFFEVSAVLAPPQPVSAVSCFPLARRRDEVIAVASALMSRKTQAARERYWQKVIAGLSKEVRGYGLSPAVVEAQLMAFHRAVGHEVAGQQPQPVSPNGAA